MTDIFPPIAETTAASLTPLALITVVSPIPNATARASGAMFADPKYICIEESIGTANSKTSGTTVVITTTEAAFIGDLVVVMTAWDNNNNSTISGPDSDTWTVTDNAPGGSNNYIFVAGAEDAGTNARTANGILYAYLVRNLPVGSTITVTYNSTRTAKAALAHRIIFKANTVSGIRISTLAHKHDRAVDPSSLHLNFDGLLNSYKIILHSLSAEGPNTDAYTWDTNYNYLPGDGTTGSTDDTNMHVRGGIRIGDTSLTEANISVTSTTADRDYTHLVGVLYPIPISEAPIAQYPRIFNNTAFAYRDYVGGYIHSQDLGTSDANVAYCAVKGIPKNILAVVLISWGNNNGATTTGPDDAQHVCEDISGNTWVFQAGAQRATTADAATHATMYTCYITNEIPKGGWIRVTQPNSKLQNRGISVHLFSVESSVTRQDRTHVHDASVDPSSLTLNNLPYRKYLLLHCVAAEAPLTDSYTWDADYTQLTAIGNGTTAANSNTVLGSYRIAELTSDTIDITSTTGDRDYTQLLVALYTDPIPRINVKLGG